MIPNKKNNVAMIILVIINISVFFIGNVINIDGISLHDIFIYKGAMLLGRNVVGSQEFYRFFTSMFLHSDFNHLYSNMITLIAFGYYLSQSIGNIKFLLVYFIGGAGANLLSILVYKYLYKYDVVSSIGASGCIYAIVGAFILIIIVTKASLLRRNLRFSMFIIFAGIFFGGSSGVNNAAHLGGIITGFLVMSVIYFFKKGGVNGKRLYIL